jgi:SAM-dependent methyltransferase
VTLAASDEPERFRIQLCHRATTLVDLRGRRVLGVGCGHVGGASYLMRTLRPASYTGPDLNPASIAFCRKRHNLPGLEFVQGGAENLSFPDQSFDAVINIESSHGYPRFPRLLGEVARVLCRGGHSDTPLYADFCPYVRVAEWEAAPADAPKRLLSRADIKIHVRRAPRRYPVSGTEQTAAPHDREPHQTPHASVQRLRYEPRRPRLIQMSSQTPNNAAVTPSTSADTPQAAIYGCSTSRRDVLRVRKPCVLGTRTPLRYAPSYDVGL